MALARPSIEAAGLDSRRPGGTEGTKTCRTTHLVVMKGRNGRELSDGHTTIYGQAGAGDEARFRAGEERHEGCDLLGGAEAPEGNLRLQPVDVVGSKRGESGARLQVVNRDALRREVDGEAARHGSHCGLAHGVEGSPRVLRDVGDNAANVDHTPALLHVRRRCLNPDEGGAD